MISDVVKAIRRSFVEDYDLWEGEVRFCSPGASLTLKHRSGLTLKFVTLNDEVACYESWLTKDEQLFMAAAQQDYMDEGTRRRSVVQEAKNAVTRSQFEAVFVTNN